uniref:Uncharacterized protein n=1 Tax=Solanum lycopersicum TaxID=4081 RepID=A0A3Q7IH61_SOLLC
METIVKLSITLLLLLLTLLTKGKISKE